MNPERLRFPNDHHKDIGGILKDFKARRAALIRALTTELNDLYEQSNPAIDGLCLYGFPDGEWAVGPLVENSSLGVLPLVGFNRTRNMTNKLQWSIYVAKLCDAWLSAVTIWFGIEFELNIIARRELADKIGSLPAIFEIVKATCPVCDGKFVDDEVFFCEKCLTLYHDDCLVQELHRLSKCPC